MNLSDREYWKPSEAAAVLGRTAAYWAKKFDEGFVCGYTDGNRRHIKAESAREFLARLVSQNATRTPAATQYAEAQEVYRHWNHNRRRVAS
jgi:hypothetical protein